MTNTVYLQARRFQSLVATYLDLAPNSNESTVREALRRQGPGYIQWYDTRINAIVENKESPNNRRGTRGGRRVTLLEPIKKT